MAEGLVAKKIGMTSMYNKSGKILPVTVLYAPPGQVLQVKDSSKDGYDAVQVGFFQSRPARFPKPFVDHQKKAFAFPMKPISSKDSKRNFVWSVLREFHVDGGLLDSAAGAEDSTYKVGSVVSLDIFEVEQLVKVSGISKGKGFQGAMKRHGFGGGRASHGSGFYRAPGSLGASASPSRVFKGKKLAGRMGGNSVTLSNLQIVDIDREKNYIFIKGPIPGPPSSYVNIEKNSPVNAGSGKTGK